jgi:thioredoxin-related protein
MKVSKRSVGASIIICFILLILLSYLSAYKHIHSKRIQIGEIAPDDSLHFSEGKIVRLNELHYKYVILLFIDPMCPVCINEIESVKQISYGNPSILILGIINAKDEELSNEIGAPNIKLVLSNNNFFKQYGVSRVPTLIILDKEKKVIFERQGYHEVPDQEILEVIE